MDTETKVYIQMHLDAGLVLTGFDKEGVMEWMGTDKQWEAFDEASETGE